MSIFHDGTIHVPIYLKTPQREIGGNRQPVLHGCGLIRSQTRYHIQILEGQQVGLTPILKHHAGIGGIHVNGDVPGIPQRHGYIKGIAAFHLNCRGGHTNNFHRIHPQLLGIGFQISLKPSIRSPTGKDKFGSILSNRQLIVNNHRVIRNGSGRIAARNGIGTQQVGRNGHRTIRKSQVAFGGIQ